MRIKKENTMCIIIDDQEKLIPSILEKEQLLFCFCHSPKILEPAKNQNTLQKRTRRNCTYFKRSIKNTRKNKSLRQNYI